MVNVRYVLTDGATHVVDSSSQAFGIATKYSFQQALNKGDKVILEPIMNVEVTVPKESYVRPWRSMEEYQRMGLEE